MLLTIQNAFRSVIKNAKFNLPNSTLLIYILMNTVKNFTTLPFPISVKVDRCVGSCNTLNALSSKVCVSNKTEDLNLSVFIKIRGMNESKTLSNHISCECKCKFDGTISNSNQWWNK